MRSLINKTSRVKSLVSRRERTRLDTLIVLVPQRFRREIKRAQQAECAVLREARERIEEGPRLNRESVAGGVNEGR